MARPQKNDLNYFSHDKDMRNDIKIRNLRRKFGHKGYSIYVMMLEHLSNCEYLQYEWNELSIELLVPDFDIDADELVEIINHCIKLNLFQIELGVLFSEKFYERNSKVLTDRSSFDLKNSPLSKLKRDLLSKTEINPNLPNESTQSKVKDSIVKQSKVENSKVENSIVQESILKNSIFIHYNKNSGEYEFEILTQQKRDELSPEDFEKYNIELNYFNKIKQDA
jgi:hypothetical protein